MDKTYENLKKLKSKGEEIEFEAEIPLQIIEVKTAKILAEVSANFELPGFRKGKVPTETVKQHINQMHLLEDAANDALRDAIKEISEDENLNIIGAPHVTVTKIAPGNPVGFKVKFSLMPEISLPDYKKIGHAISERKDDTETTEIELKDSIMNIRKMIAKQKNEKEPKNLPELNDELVKQLGPFKTVEEFKIELKKQLNEEKKYKILEAKRDEIISEIVKHSRIKVPESLLEQELQEYVANRDAELEKMKLSLDSYLKETNKTAEALEKEERKLIEEQIKTRLIMGEIQKKENLKADEEEIHKNAEVLAMRYPNRDHHYLHHMAEAMILNKKLFEILEGKSILPNS